MTDTKWVHGEHRTGNGYDWCKIATLHSHVNNPLRDANRVLAHSLSDEAYVKPTYDFYRPSAREQWMDAIGCAASMAGILIAAVVLWLTGVGVFIALSGGPK